MRRNQANRSRTLVAAAIPPRAMLLLALGMTALWTGAVLTATGAGLGGWSLGSLFPEAAPAAQPVAPPAPAVVRAESDREAIAELIAVYQRRADEAWKQQLADAIYRESVAVSLDPLIVASIIATESSFRSQAVSHKGAIGLMQLRPFVAKQVARQSEIEWNGVETLYAPDDNVRLGVLYYRELLQRFDGDHAVALTAYNYGPTRVRRQLSAGTYGGSDYAMGVLELYETMSRKRSF